MSVFDKFQLTILVLFYLVLIGRMLQLLFKGTNPFVVGIGKKGFEFLLEAAFMPGLVLWTVEIVTHSLKLDFHVFPAVLYSQLFDIPVLKVLGSILIATGFVIFMLSLISFGHSWRVGIDTRNAGALVTTGIFSLTRNPIFVFLDAYFVGTWLVYPNLFFGAAAIITILGIHWQILQEERFLKTHYGEMYQRYSRAVRRYL